MIQPRTFAPVGVDLSWYYLVLPLLAAPPLILWRGSRRRVLAWLCVVALALYTAWFFETHQSRFLLSTTPLICLIMSAGVGWLMHGHGKPVEVVTGTALILAVLGTGWLFRDSDRALLRTRWPLLTGAQRH